MIFFTVTPSTSGTVVAPGAQVDTDQFRDKKRLQMCEDAMEQQALADMDIKFIGDNTAPNRFSKYWYLVELFSGERYEMQAFGCSTQPPIYLQIRCWQFKCRIVSVIVEKKETEKLNKQMKDLEESRTRSSKSKERIVSEEADLFKQRELTLIDEPIEKTNLYKQKELRLSSQSSDEFIVLDKTDLAKQRGSRQSKEFVGKFEKANEQREPISPDDIAGTTNFTQDERPPQPIKIVYIESIRLGNLMYAFLFIYK